MHTFLFNCNCRTARVFAARYGSTLGLSGLDLFNEAVLTYVDKSGTLITEPSKFIMDQFKCGRYRFFTKEASWYDNWTKGGARFHPSKAVHMLRAEILAWLFSMTLFDAIEMVNSDLKQHDVNTLIRSKWCFVWCECCLLPVMNYI